MSIFSDQILIQFAKFFLDYQSLLSIIFTTFSHIKSPWSYSSFRNCLWGIYSPLFSRFWYRIQVLFHYSCDFLSKLIDWRVQNKILFDVVDLGAFNLLSSAELRICCALRGPALPIVKFIYVMSVCVYPCAWKSRKYWLCSKYKSFLYDKCAMSHWLIHCFALSLSLKSWLNWQIIGILICSRRYTSKFWLRISDCFTLALSAMKNGSHIVCFTCVIKLHESCQKAVRQEASFTRYSLDRFGVEFERKHSNLYTFSSTRGFLKHHETKHDIERDAIRLICLKCQTVFDQPGLAEQHIKRNESVAKQSNDREKSYFCSLCPKKEFQGLKSFVEHAQNKHNVSICSYVSCTKILDKSLNHHCLI